MGKVQRITDDQIKKIIEMYLDNYTKTDIAKKLNISTQSVTKYLLKNHIQQKEYFLSEEIKDLICDLYINEKMGIKKICKKLNVDYGSVKRALNKKGIKLRSLSESQKKYTLNRNYFDVIDTQNKAYILGLLYADGNVGKDNYVIQICLQEEDKHILEQIKNELNSNRPLYFKETNNKNNSWKNTYSLILNDEHMHQSLINKGVVPQKTFKIKFPEFLDEKFIKHFIRGYFDGDGCFCFSKRKDRRNCYSSNFTLTGTSDLCQRIKEIINEKFNIHCSICYCHQKYDSPIRCLSIGGRKNCMKILDWIYDDAEMYLIRKKNKYLEFCNLYNSTY